MAINAQIWLDNILTTLPTGRKNIKTILSRKTTVSGATPGLPIIEQLNGELKIEDFPELELLDLDSVNELDKLTISNCPKLQRINLPNSGIKKLELGSGLDSLLYLDFSFELNMTDRSGPRSLDELDLSNAPNLKVIKCYGTHDTKLKGVEKLFQLQKLDSGDVITDTEVVTFPVEEFRKWKKRLDDITTGPDHLDLLKGGSGTDKDEVDPDKLKNYKQKAADYDRIHAKLSGRVSNSDLDNLLNSSGAGLQSQLDQAKQEVKNIKLERDNLQEKLSEAGSKLLKSIVTELQLQLKTEDITKEKVVEKIKELINKPSSTAEKDAEIRRLKKT